MHRCLNIHEIVQRIADELQKTRKRESALLSMALTCRAFSDPAIESLWADLLGLRPLLACLPDDFLKNSPENPPPVGISRIPMPEEWSRFQFHARHVTTLCIDENSCRGSGYFPPTAFLRFLVDHYPGPGPVLPRLDCLFVREWDASPYTHVFLHQPLQYLEIRSTDVSHLMIVLKHVEQNTSTLRYLEFNEENNEGLDERSVQAQLSKAVCSLHELKFLVGGPLPLHSPALLHLSSSRTLLQLHLWVSEFNLDVWRSPSWGPFESLESLDIWFDEFVPPRDRASFLQSFAAPSLTNLDLRMELPASTEFLDTLLGAVSHLSKLQRCKIEICSSTWPGWAERDQFVEGTALYPLFRLKHMYHFELLNVPVEFIADDLREMVIGWPTLETLRLIPRTVNSPYSCMELDDFALIAEYCRYICTLDVELAFVAEDWTWERTDSEVLPSSLSSLRLGRSRIPPVAAPEVAAYLARLFPETSIYHNHPTERWERPREPDAVDYADVIDGIERLKRKIVAEATKDSTTR